MDDVMMCWMLYSVLSHRLQRNKYSRCKCNPKGTLFSYAYHAQTQIRFSCTSGNGGWYITDTAAMPCMLEELM
jgi:hypothetical protein